MGNAMTTSPPSPDQRERWHSDPETVERRDREFGDRATDREPSDAHDRSPDDRDDNRPADRRQPSPHPKANDVELAEGKR